MKKLISVTLCLLMLCSAVSLAACGKNDGNYAMSVTPGDAATLPATPGEADTQPTVTQPAVTLPPVTFEPADDYIDGSERFTLTTDQTTVAPGETFTVTFRAENCKNVACFDVLLTASANCTVADAQEKEKGEFITTVSRENGGVHYSGIVATTTSFDGLDLLTVTYKVSADAAPGDKITVEGSFPQFLVGTDESGDQTADATDLFAVEPLTLTVG